MGGDFQDGVGDCAQSPHRRITLRPQLPVLHTNISKLKCQKTIVRSGRSLQSTLGQRGLQRPRPCRVKTWRALLSSTIRQRKPQIPSNPHHQSFPLFFRRCGIERLPGLLQFCGAWIARLLGIVFRHPKQQYVLVRLAIVSTSAAAQRRTA